jgi:hypothetical protein
MGNPSAASMLEMRATRCLLRRPLLLWACVAVQVWQKKEKMLKRKNDFL